MRIQKEDRRIPQSVGQRLPAGLLQRQVGVLPLQSLLQIALLVLQGGLTPLQRRLNAAALNMPTTPASPWSGSSVSLSGGAALAVALHGDACPPSLRSAGAIQGNRVSIQSSSTAPCQDRPSI